MGSLIPSEVWSWRKHWRIAVAVAGAWLVGVAGALAAIELFG